MDTKHHAAASPVVEGDGVSYSGLVWFVVILTVTTLVCQGLMLVLLKTFKYQQATVEISPVAQVTEHEATNGRVHPDMNAIGTATGPAPKLLVNEPGNLAAFREHEHETLTTYGYIDKNTGVMRIPIERAKELVLERGLPVRGQAPAVESKPADARPAATKKAGK